jgi:predicted GIY-YIG superfamily endonuclease
MTIQCFKKLCLKARTSKADEIHDYYISLEDIMNELVAEQSTELQQKLQQQLKNKSGEKNHEIFMMNFKNKQVVYMIEVEKDIIKFGHTKDIVQRLREHKKQFGDDISIKILYETIYNREFEDMIKNQYKKYTVTKKYRTIQTELIQLSEYFTFDDLVREFNKLKIKFDENLIPKLFNEITELKIYIAKLEQDQKTTEVLSIIEDNKKMKNKITELEGKLESDYKGIEEKKLELRKQELSLRYSVYSKIKNKNKYASEHKIIDGVEMKFCMGIQCCEESESDGQWLPLDNFGKSSQSKDGYRCDCKRCRNVYERSYYERQTVKMTPEELQKSREGRSLKLRIELTENNEKTCSKCKVLKDISCFNRNGNYITGETKYYSACSACLKESKKSKHILN